MRCFSVINHECGKEGKREFFGFDKNVVGSDLVAIVALEDDFGVWAVDDDKESIEQLTQYYEHFGYTALHFTIEIFKAHKVHTERRCRPIRSVLILMVDTTDEDGSIIMLRFLFAWLARAVRNSILSGVRDATDVLLSDDLGKGDEGKFTLENLRGQLNGLIGEPVQLTSPDDEKPVILLETSVPGEDPEEEDAEPVKKPSPRRRGAKRVS